MRARVLVLLAVLLVAAAAFFLLRDGGGRDAGEVARGPGEDGASGVRREGDGPDAPSLVGRGEEKEAAGERNLATAPVSAWGKVIDPRGAGVPGVEVVALPLAARHPFRDRFETRLRRVAAPPPSPPVVAARTTTDAKGRFRLHGLAGRRRNRFEARPFPPWAGVAAEPYAWPPIQGPVLLRVVPGGPLRVRVVDGEGRGIAATVELWSENPHGRMTEPEPTDGQGRKAWAALPLGSANVRVEAPGRGGRMFPVTVPSQAEVLLPLAHPGGAAVAGRVLTPGGDPIPDAQVLTELTPARKGNGTWAGLGARTGPDGTYRVAGLPPGTLREVSAWAPGWQHVIAYTKPVTLAAGQTHEVDLTLRPASRIEGRVTDEDGTPLTGVHVRASRGPTAVSDGDGLFVLEPLKPGSVYVTARKEGWYLPRQEGGRVTQRTLHRIGVRVDKPAVPLTFVLTRGIAVQGRCVDPGGEPVAGVCVTAGRVRSSPVQSAVDGLWTEPPPTAVSDAHGAFCLPGMPPGTRWALEAEGAGHRGRLADTGRLEAGADLDVGTLQVERAVRISGRVIDGAGAPVGAVQVDAQDHGTHALTDESGAFVLEGLDAKPCHVFVRDGITSLAKVRVEDLAWGERREGLEIVVPPRLPVRGRLLDEGSEPVRYTRMELRPVDDSAGHLLQMATDGEGRFDLRVWGRGPYRAVVGSVMVSERVVPGEEEILLRMPPALPPLTVRIVDPQGEPVPQVLVTLQRTMPDGSRPRSPSGWVRGGVLELGPTDRANLTEIVVSDPQRGPYRPMDLLAATVPVGPAQRELVVTLRPGLRIEGVVRDEHGRPVQGVVVKALPIGDVGQYTRAYTGADGRFVLKNLVACTYALNVGGDEWLPAAPVRVEAGAAGVELRVERGAPFVVEVRNADGELMTVPDGYVELETRWRGRDIVREEGTEGTGSCTLFVPREAAYTITVRAAVDIGYPPVRLRDVPYGEGSVVVRLTSGVYVEGEVVTPQGQPVREGRVSAETLDGLELGGASLDAQRNTFRVGPVPPGRIRLVAGGARGLASSAPLVVEAPARGVRLVLREQRIIEGRLRDAGSKTWRLEWMTERTGWTIRVEPDGSFRTPRVPADLGTLYGFEEEGTRYVLLEDVDPRTASFDLTPKEGKVVRGRIEGEGARAVRLTRGDIGRGQAVAEDATFEFEGVPEGVWTLTVHDRNDRELARRENVPPGTTDLVIALPKDD